MSPRTTEQRLDDITEAIEAIRSHERRCEQAGIGRDELLRRDAVVRRIAVIGEAAASLDGDVKDEEPDIPWSDIAGMRIILDHRYFEEDPEVVWSTVDGFLEPLREAVERIRQQPFGDGFGEVESDTARLVRDATEAASTADASTGRGAATCGARTAGGSRCRRPVSESGVRCRDHR